MSVYAIYDIEITDHEAYARYMPVSQSVARHGGEILVATDAAGPWMGPGSPPGWSP